MPSDTLAVIKRHVLLLESEVADADAAFCERVTHVTDSGQFHSSVEQHCLDGFDIVAKYFVGIALPKDATSINPYLESQLERVKTKRLEFLSAAHEPLRADLRAESDTRVALLLRGRISKIMGELKLELFDRVPAPVVLRKPVTPATKKRRKELVRQYRHKEGLTVPDLARKAAMSASAINGIINEKRDKFSDTTQSRLLKVLSVTKDDWYN